jgi:hypothetical protein
MFDTQSSNGDASNLASYTFRRGVRKQGRQFLVGVTLPKLFRGIIRKAMTPTRKELPMNRIFSLVVTATLATMLLADSANAVTLRVGQATVSGAGETATICVDLETGGEQVAGTQNDLTWNEQCATLSGLKSCRASSGHGKDLHASFPNGDGHPPLRAFVFSMKDLGAMSDTELYCCDFTSELTSGGSCSVKAEETKASNPTGQALTATGSVGGIVSRGAAGGGVAGGVTGSGGGGGGGSSDGGSGGGGGSVGGGGGSAGAAGGGAVGGGGAASGGGVAASGGGVAGGVVGLGQPPSQVLPGGVPGERPIDTEALAEAASDTARAEAERILERRVEAEPEAEAIEPTEMPTTLAVPPTSPAAKPTTPARGTPTAKAPTVGRTPAAAPAAAEASKKEESSSWFGCQVSTGGAGGSLFVLIGVVGILVNRLRRRA